MHTFIYFKSLEADYRESISKAKLHGHYMYIHASHESRERQRNLQRAVNLPQNVNRATARSSLHSESKEGEEEEEEEGLARWLEADNKHLLS